MTIRRYDRDILKSNRRLNQQAENLLRGKRPEKKIKKKKQFRQNFSKQEREEYSQMMKHLKSIE